ncbi:MAG: lytic transglycosylase [Alphaproteobacteria bacterium]|nr:MAG: lytic transglycosylase [Alphaproteobacteria bacterium]
MSGARHARAFGRVAVLGLCCVLVADQDADARRAGRHRARPAPASEFTGKPNPPGPMRWADTRFEPVAWGDLDGWAADDHAAAFAAFAASCRAVVAGAKGSRDTRPVYPALLETCRKARALAAPERDAARRFFEENFRPVRVGKIDDPNGFLTGYYEPVVDGSRTLTDEFKVPLYGRPRDIVHMGRKRKGESFPNNGRVVRRIARGRYVPYFDRAQIEDGALATRNLEIAYLRDANDLLFIQIQGSARIRLTDGSLLRVNYDSHNGQPYTPVGRILIERGIIPREEMSMDRIRKWMAENPEGGKELRRQNKSFVFFRTVGLPEHEEARGAQGVPLTATRSIAVDKALHVYGTPFFIGAELPIDGEASATRFRKLMIAQDTGSAIVGPARADIYFGSGETAGRIAGRVKNPARFVMLLPRALDPVEAGRAMPLPEPRPKQAPKGEPATAEMPAGLPLSVPVPLPRPRP